MNTKPMPAKRSVSESRDYVIETLVKDHEQFKKACRKFEQLQLAGELDEAEELVRQACGELTVHATLEEELLYPAAKRIDTIAVLVEEAEVEHASAKMLIADLEDMKPTDPKWKASFIVLGEYVKHHIKEEEQELFPKLQKAKIDWVEIASEFEARRRALQKAQGIAEDPTA